MLPNYLFFQKWKTSDERDRAIRSFMEARQQPKGEALNLAGMTLDQLRETSSQLEKEIQDIKDKQSRMRPKQRMQIGRLPLFQGMTETRQAPAETKRPLLRSM